MESRRQWRPRGSEPSRASLHCSLVLSCPQGPPHPHASTPSLWGTGSWGKRAPSNSPPVPTLRKCEWAFVGPSAPLDTFPHPATLRGLECRSEPVLSRLLGYERSLWGDGTGSVRGEATPGVSVVFRTSESQLCDSLPAGHRAKRHDSTERGTEVRALRLGMVMPALGRLAACLRKCWLQKPFALLTLWATAAIIPTCRVPRKPGARGGHRTKTCPQERGTDPACHPASMLMKVRRRLLNAGF